MGSYCNFHFLWNPCHAFKAIGNGFGSGWKWSILGHFCTSLTWKYIWNSWKELFEIYCCFYPYKVYIISITLNQLKNSNSSVYRTAMWSMMFSYHITFYNSVSILSEAVVHLPFCKSFPFVWSTFLSLIVLACQIYDIFQVKLMDYVNFPFSLS